MRALIFGLAIFAAACSVETGKGPSHGGYSVDIRANGNDQIYVVTAPDGRVTAARAHDGASALLDSQALQQALASMPAPASNPRYDDHQVSIRGPGFSLQASGDDNDAESADGNDHEAAATPASPAKPAADNTDGHADTHTDAHSRGHVTMNIGGFGLNVNADEGGPGDADDRAQVRLTGLSAHDARKFITDADELSPQVQAQMLTALGLNNAE
jgi:hypothetical protein